MAQKTSGNVDACPVTKEIWEAREEAKKGDSGGQSVYHCLADKEGRKWERCVEKTRIKQGNCPIFRSDGFIDWKPCNISASTCPNSSFLSNEVYKHVYCFGNNSFHIPKNEKHKKAEGVNAGLVIGIVFLVLVIVGIIAAGIISFWKRRSGRNTQDDREQLELLNESVIGGSDETVKEAISTGIQLLLRTKVKSMVVLGKFGSGVYSTSCSISERFRELKSNKWEILNCRYTEIPDTVNDKTIVFVYGWFGIWNDDLCSVDRAKTACQSLIRILNETTKVKFIIGMRSDLYMKYHGVLKVDDFQRHLFENEITLDSANTTEDAKFAYFYENMRKKCQKDECVFQNMTCEMIQTGKDNAVGMFLKLNLMERYHDQIHEYKGEWDISMAIRDHFISLENDETKRYMYTFVL